MLQHIFWNRTIWYFTYFFIKWTDQDEQQILLKNQQFSHFVNHSVGWLVGHIFDIPWGEMGWVSLSAHFMFGCSSMFWMTVYSLRVCSRVLSEARPLWVLRHSHHTSHPLISPTPSSKVWEHTCFCEHNHVGLLCIMFVLPCSFLLIPLSL